MKIIALAAALSLSLSPMTAHAYTTTSNPVADWWSSLNDNQKGQLIVGGAVGLIALCGLLCDSPREDRGSFPGDGVTSGRDEDGGLHCEPNTLQQVPECVTKDQLERNTLGTN